VLTPLDGQRYQPRHAAPPATSPPPGLRAGWPCSMRPQLYLPSLAWPLTAPTPPLAGRVVGAGQPAGSPAMRPQLASQLFSVSNSPSWADVVRNGKPPSPPPPATTTATTTPATADFLALYERCVCYSLKTRINISNNTGIQEISVTCQLPSATASVRRRCRRRPRRRGLIAGPAVTLPPRAPHIRPKPPPVELPPLQSSLPETPPAPSPLPAKRTRKTAKRRCEVELLRGVESDYNLHLSLPLHSPPPPTCTWSPPSPSPAPATTPA
jgi:hypothetical protein